MIGKNQIEIKGQDFIQGMSTSPDTTDGGYSPETRNVSLTNIVGCIAPTYASSATTLSDNLICSADAGSNTTLTKFILGNNGHVYGQNASTGAIASYGTYSGNCGNLYSDMVSYLGNVYFTTDRDICLISNSNATSGSITSTWWSSTESKTPLLVGKKHHLFVFNGIMFITDGNMIHSWDGVSIITSRLALNSDQEILDLGGDLAQGRMLVSFVQNVTNASNLGFLQTTPYQYYVGSWDTSDPLKFIYPATQVEDVVWSFIYFGGYQYVVYGSSFGYYTGSGIQFLRDLNFDQTVAVQVINKHKIATSATALYLADLNQVLAYENITKAGKIFNYKYTETTLSGINANILCLFKSSPTKIGLGFDDSSFSVKTFDLSNSNSSIQDGKFYSLQYYFPKPVRIRDVDIEFQSAVTPSGSNEVGILYLLDDNNFQSEALIYNRNSSLSYYSLRNITPNVTDKGRKCGRIQLQYAFAIAVPIRRFIIRYDVVED